MVWMCLYQFIFEFEGLEMVRGRRDIRAAKNNHEWNLRMLSRFLYS